MLKVYVYVLCVYVVSGLTCPPSCEPTRNSDCNVYTKHASCSQDVKDISSSEAHCGCLWQAYIQTIEPAARVIFSGEGKQCYLWASKTCSILENNVRSMLRRKNSPARPKTTVFKDSHDLQDILQHIQKIESIQNIRKHGQGVAKKRRRNGVGVLSKELENLIKKERRQLKNAQKVSIAQARSGMQVKSRRKNRRHATGEFIGKPGKSGAVSWVEVVPERSTKAPVPSVPVMNPPNTVKNIYTVRQHWIDLDMPVDQFKLGVFLIILLLNIIVVVVLIFCRGSEGSKKQFEAKKQVGDLNSDDYLPDTLDGKPGQGGARKTMKSPISVFLDSCRNKMNRAKKKENVSTQYMNMMEVRPEEYAQNGNAYSKRNSPYVDAGMYQSPAKISRGLYDNIEEEMEGLLDHTYEEPIQTRSNQTDSREFHKRQYRVRSDSISEDESPTTKYYPRESEASNKSVSFSLSPNTYLTLQDRMLVHPSTRRKRRSRKGLSMPFKMTK